MPQKGTREMSTLGIICTYAGAIVLGCGLAFGCLVAMARREIRRRVAQARADRLPKVQHFKP
jgi:hypothetical protein